MCLRTLPTTTNVLKFTFFQLSNEGELPLEFRIKFHRRQPWQIDRDFTKVNFLFLCILRENSLMDFFHYFLC